MYPLHFPLTAECRRSCQSSANLGVSRLNLLLLRLNTHSRSVRVVFRLRVASRPGPLVPRQRTCGDCIGMSVSCHKRTNLDQMALDRVLIPFEPDARHVGYMQLPVFELIWRLENGICPILPLKPMRSFRDAHHVSRDLRVEVS
jgi:hypothetical protein